MERSLDERAFALAVYMLEHDATVRAAAAKFGVSKSTVHMAVTITSGSYGVLNEEKPQDVVESERAGAEAPAPVLYVRSIRSGGVQPGVGHSCACAAAAARSASSSFRTDGLCSGGTSCGASGSCSAFRMAASALGRLTSMKTFSSASAVTSAVFGFTKV